MIQVPGVSQGADDAKAHTHALGLDEVAQGRIEGGEEALPRALGIEAPEALQTLAHRGDADTHQQVGIARSGGGEHRVQVHGGRVQTWETSPPRFYTKKACARGCFVEKAWIANSTWAAPAQCFCTLRRLVREPGRERARSCVSPIRSLSFLRGAAQASTDLRPATVRTAPGKGCPVRLAALAKGRSGWPA